MAYVRVKLAGTDPKDAGGALEAAEASLNAELVEHGAEPLYRVQDPYTFTQRLLEAGIPAMAIERHAVPGKAAKASLAANVALLVGFLGVLALWGESWLERNDLQQQVHAASEIPNLLEGMPATVHHIIEVIPSQQVSEVDLHHEMLARGFDFDTSNLKVRFTADDQRGTQYVAWYPDTGS